MQCWIYKGSRRAETYLYLPNEGDTSQVPSALVEAMGTLVLVMELSLSHELDLARASAGQVMRDLEGSGYYLQMPPAEQTRPDWLQ